MTKFGLVMIIILAVLLVFVGVSANYIFYNYVGCDCENEIIRAKYEASKETLKRVLYDYEHLEKNKKSSVVKYIDSLRYEYQNAIIDGE